ncbi:MAG: chemotaxis protein CheW [Acidobacteriota bacterium]
MTTSRFILFRISAESFLADVMTVRQIVPWTSPRPVPNAPPLLEGVVLVSGEAVPVIDIGSQFSSGAGGEVESHPLLMLLESESGAIGLKVDEVRQILPIEMDEIVAAPLFVQGLAGDLLAGIVRRDEAQYLILDLEHILSPETRGEIRRLCDATEATV